MRQRSRLYSIALARILPTAYARTANPQRHAVTLACAHSRTHAGTPRSAAGLGAHCALNCKRRRDALRARRLRVTLQRATDGMQQTTCKTGQATDKRQHATESVRHATCNVTRCDAGQATDSAHGMRHGTVGRATEIRHHATENVRHATKKGHADTIQRAACRRRPLENGQQTTCSMQHASGKMQPTTCSMQHGQCN